MAILVAVEASLATRLRTDPLRWGNLARATGFPPLTASAATANIEILAAELVTGRTPRRTARLACWPVYAIL